MQVVTTRLPGLVSFTVTLLVPLKVTVAKTARGGTPEKELMISAVMVPAVGQG